MCHTGFCAQLCHTIWHNSLLCHIFPCHIFFHTHTILSAVRQWLDVYLQSAFFFCVRISIIRITGGQCIGSECKHDQAGRNHRWVIQKESRQPLPLAVLKQKQKDSLDFSLRIGERIGQCNILPPTSLLESVLAPPGKRTAWFNNVPLFLNSDGRLKPAVTSPEGPLGSQSWLFFCHYSSSLFFPG